MSSPNALARRRGKTTERALAKRLNGHRNGNTGLATADVEAGPFSIECKAWKRLPVAVCDALAQAIRNAPTGKTPVLVMHEAGQRHASDLVVIRLGDFEDWFGRLQAPIGEEGEHV